VKVWRRPSGSPYNCYMDVGFRVVMKIGSDYENA